MNRPRVWPLAILLVIEAFLLFAGLGNTYLWEDEANTACYGRNILKTGLPTAWDGVNLVSWHEGLCLSENLLESTGWLQYYLVAASFAVLGQNTFAARFPFALLGLATVALFYFLAARYLRNHRAALLSTIFLALSVPFLLYVRNARYYSPAILLATLCWFLSVELTLERKAKFVLFIICCTLFFYTNFLLFAAFFGAILLAGLLFEGRKKRLVAMAWSVPAIVCLTLPWYLWLAPHRSADVYLLASLRRGNPLFLFCAYLRDYNAFGFFPALAAAVLVFVTVRMWKRDHFLARRLAGASVLILLFTAALSLVSPQVLPPRGLVDMRYATATLPAFALVAGLLCHQVMEHRRTWGTALFVGMLFTDVLTLQHFSPVYSRALRVASPLPLPFRCHLAEYFFEITRDRTNPSEAVVKWLSERVRPGELAVTSPPDDDDPLIFYLGDKLRLCGQLNEHDERLMSRWRDRLPLYIYSPRVVPDWIVYFNRTGIRQSMQDYIRANNVPYDVFLLPVFGTEFSRPEIPLRTFRDPPPPNSDTAVMILRRRSSDEAPRPGS